MFKQGMKGPTRPAPSVPGFNVNRYSPVTNWNDDPFGADLFEPTPQSLQKKKPPPRPPPPKINKVPDIPAKPSHFIRRPTVLTSLLSRKNKSTNQTVAQTNQIISSLHSTDFQSEHNNYDSSKIFSKCETKNVQTGALIDLSSPPSSPTFTTRSSSDGLSVDSFGSDGTTSTNNHNALHGGNASQAESGFEDDFDLFLSSRKVSKEDTFDDFNTVDPFSPPHNVIKSNYSKKTYSKDLVDVSRIQMPVLKGPTIIRVKPARPKPPDNAAILKSTLGNNLQLSMNVNTTTPIQKITAFSENFDSKPLSWDDDRSSSDREASPPMPSIPPPPPPPMVDEDLPTWPDECDLNDLECDSHDSARNDLEEPYAISLFNYSTGHPDDLEFKANTKIRLIRRVDNEWLFGQVNGSQGLFPANFVEIKVPLPNEQPTTPQIGLATAIYDFEAVQTGDLTFKTGDTITVTHKLSDEWYFGECKGLKGQFPINYVQMNL